MPISFQNQIKSLSLGARVVSASFLLGGIVSCAGNEGRKIAFSEIRQVPPAEDTQKFAETSSFHADRHPNIYFIFFDTLRPDLALSGAEHIKSFFDKNFSFVNAYGSGTATYYSTYSLFHSHPGFLTYLSIPKTLPDHKDYGSVHLKILKKLGYQLNNYGYYWGCVTSKAESGSSWDRFLVSFFGWQSNLLDRCQSDTSYDSKFNGNQDEVTVEELEKKLPTVITTPESHFSLITFYNNHDPYKWGSASDIASREVGDKEDFTKENEIKNRYKNSILASNINFHRLMKLIESLPGYKDAVIVLFSDHGEMLYEKDHANRHGGIPYREKIRSMLSFQFTEQALHHTENNERYFASIEDIFPTIEDYLGVSPPVPEKWVSGKSLLSYARRSVLVVQSNLENPTRHMILENKDYKAWIRVDDEDFYRSQTLQLLKITDPEDNPLALKEENCFSKTEEECKQWLFSQFPEALSELYPSSSVAALSRTLFEKRRLPAEHKNSRSSRSKRRSKTRSR